MTSRGETESSEIYSLLGQMQTCVSRPHSFIIWLQWLSRQWGKRKSHPRKWKNSCKLREKYRELAKLISFMAVSQFTALYPTKLVLIVVCCDIPTVRSLSLIERDLWKIGSNGLAMRTSQKALRSAWNRAAGNKNYQGGSVGCLWLGHICSIHVVLSNSCCDVCTAKLILKLFSWKSIAECPGLNDDWKTCEIQ